MAGSVPKGSDPAFFALRAIKSLGALRSLGSLRSLGATLTFLQDFSLFRPFVWIYIHQVLSLRTCKPLFYYVKK